MSVELSQPGHAPDLLNRPEEQSPEPCSVWSRVGRTVAAAALLVSNTLTLYSAEEVLTAQPGLAYDASTGDYPWADAPHVARAPVGPASDDITWGYTSKSICDSKSDAFDCSSYKLGNFTTRDQWGYDLRNCVSYVAWRMGVEFGVNASGMGSAASWDDRAPARGWIVDTSPEVGDIAQWDSGGGGFGHVGVVEKVNSDGSTDVADYNRGFDGGFGQRKGIRAEKYIDVNGVNPAGFRLKVGDTAPPTSSPAGDFNHDGFSDTYIIASDGTASGRVETHILQGTNFQSFLANIVTRASATSTADTAYLLGDYNKDNSQDLYIVGHNRTASGRLEMHILAGPNFQTSLGDWVTPAGTTTENQAQFALGDYNRDGFADLYIAALSGTDSGKTEVHVLSGTNFQNFIGHWNTPAAAVSGERVKTMLADYNHDGYADLYQVAVNNTGSGKVEVHVLNGTNFSSWLGHWVTPAGTMSGDQIQITAGDFNHDGYADIYAAYSQTASGKLEMHILNGTNFQQFLGQWTTVAPAVSGAQAEVANG